MNEETTERLSRYLDGDLDPADRAVVDRLLETDSDARRVLRQLQEVRQSLRALAAKETAPSELDVLLEPLRRTPVRRRQLRPAFQWLAAAATVVLGVSVAVEVVRRHPGPEIVTPGAESEARPAATRAPGEYYQLQPLPERRANSEGEELLGAVDHLLATPPPEPEVDLEPPPPLVVMGPLESAEGNAGEAVADEIVSPDLAKRAEPGRQQEERSRKGVRENPEREAPATARFKAEATSGAAAVAPAAASRPRPCWIALPPDDRGLALPTEVCETLEVGRYSVELVVEGGRVHEVRGTEAASALRGHEALLSDAVSKITSEPGGKVTTVKATVFVGVPAG